MRYFSPRWTILVATVWTLAYLVVAIVLVSSQNGDLSWWYLAILLVSLGALGAELTLGPTRGYPGIAAATLAVACVAAGFSIGVFLVPALVLSVWAMIRPGRVPPSSGMNKGLTISS